MNSTDQIKGFGSEAVGNATGYSLSVSGRRSATFEPGNLASPDQDHHLQRAGLPEHQDAREQELVAASLSRLVGAGVETTGNVGHQFDQQRPFVAGSSVGKQT